MCVNRILQGNRSVNKLLIFQKKVDVLKFMKVTFKCIQVWS